MNGEVQSWFQRLGYEEGFDLGEVPPAKVRKKRIDIHVILSEIIQEHWRNIFGEGGVLVLLFHA